MSKRFQNLSKYRNSVLSAAKREEWWSLPSGYVNTSGDSTPVHASADLVAFRSGPSGTAVGVLSLKHAGKIAAGAPTVQAGSGMISEVQFSPWDTRKDTDVLATAGDDGTVKFWDVPKTGLTDSLSSPTFMRRCHERRVENMLFHPTSEGLFTTSGLGEIKIWDVRAEEASYTIIAGDFVQSISWKDDGSLLASASKDNILRVFDPRSAETAIMSGQAHTGVKPTKVIWLGSSDLILSTGFSQRRDREFAIWDARNLSSSLSLHKIDTSPGILTPLYDGDTGMLFLAGKGDTSIRWWEIKTDDLSSPVSPGALPYNSNAVYTAATLVPKRALNVMECEVNRILTLASDGSAIIPISVTVPRKSHIEFHSDIFPDTKSTSPPLTASEWLSGKTKLPDLVSLDPKKLPSVDKIPVVASIPLATPSVSTPKMVIGESSAKDLQSATPTPSQSNATPRPQPKFVVPKQSAYRFLSGKCQPKYEDLRGLSTNLTGESSALEAHERLLAFPMAGPGGRVGIWPTNKTGRLPYKIPAIICGADLLDFKWNPFDKKCLATATDDGKVRIWTVAEDGIADDAVEPSLYFTAHTNRTSLLLFHPTVSNLLLTASPEQGSPSVKLWNLKTQKEIATIPHPDVVLGCAFTLDGERVATVCRDKFIRVFDARTGKELQSGPSHEGVKGCRVLWLGSTGRLLTVGFGKASQREINIYDEQNLSFPLHSITIDTSPSLLLPIYDEDISVLYLTGRGESYTLIYEITDNGPIFLTRFDSPGTQQGLSFLPKRSCDVREIEVANGYRITQSAIETISFTVPRLKKEYFQDDIYVPTRDVEKPLLDIDEWLKGEKAIADFINLAPSDMISLSQAPVEVKVERRAQVLEQEQSESERAAASMQQMFERARVDAEEEKLPQDEMEGVDDDEWDD
ncbi:uncharacterized protein SPPG_05325 [Spizellomyces punctatus DAOM BR117]|uniref:Coronin n=1 Tax=Spizellomyces punctatus (strain DAOM BR117) TaxID=645134 RepID=A0A0L0HFS5_SPIPD|nr:uncharacterized protein SPPG_05325 [Spizellomyces punctatus DAOM BR117]KNC99952.1 hypothetical protein SPPG_05325 [Spizellomyces punctatus DAOM BR117]|eukprot:XP_016607992.1 hypothetical protein SPPG_05325 [Spizellomyces punctatus DAOM BR117]